MAEQYVVVVHKGDGSAPHEGSARECGGFVEAFHDEGGSEVLRPKNDAGEKLQAECRGRRRAFKRFVPGLLLDEGHICQGDRQRWQQLGMDVAE